MKNIDGVREMLLSENLDDYKLALNILENLGMNVHERHELIETVLFGSVYTHYLFRHEYEGKDYYYESTRIKIKNDAK